MLFRNNLQLSNKVSSQAVCKRDTNVVFYTRGKWDYGTSGPGHISGAYECGWLDDTTDGVELVSGSTHTVKIISATDIDSGKVVVTNT